MAGGRRALGHAEPDRLALIAGPLREAAACHGTPVYVTDETAIAAAADELRAAFPDPWIRQYSVKANDVPAVIGTATADGRGIGANVVSRGEWALARAAGETGRGCRRGGGRCSRPRLRERARPAARRRPVGCVNPSGCKDGASAQRRRP